MIAESRFAAGALFLACAYAALYNAQPSWLLLGVAMAMIALGLGVAVEYPPEDRRWWVRLARWLFGV